jgi:hypothetical protein
MRVRYLQERSPALISYRELRLGRPLRKPLLHGGDIEDLKGRIRPPRDIWFIHVLQAQEGG